MSSCFGLFGLILEYFYQFVNGTQSIVVNGKRYNIIKQLGEGGFGFVMLVKEPNVYGEPKALKRIRIQLAEHESRARNEIAAHQAVDSDHVLKLLDSDFISSNGCLTDALLLLPFFPNGTVQDWIDRLMLDEFIPLNDILKLSMGIIKGLEAFHSLQPPLAFRDLKPANILIGSNSEAVLMDLGSVTEARVSLRSRKDALTLYDFCAETVTAPYRSPELYDPPSIGDVDESSDIW